MKKLLYILILLCTYEVRATWVVVKIDNQSDLQFIQAARKNDVEIQSISQKIKNSDSDGQVYLDAMAQFGTVGGCRIIAQTPQGQRVSLRFLGDPSYRVANGRALHADVDSRTQAGLHNQGMMARVMLEEQGVLKLIGYYCGYEQENQPFAMTIKGSGGQYQAELVPVLKKNNAE